MKRICINLLLSITATVICAFGTEYLLRILTAQTLLTNIPPAEFRAASFQSYGEISQAYMEGFAGSNWHRPNSDMIAVGQVGRQPEFAMRVHWNNMACHDSVDYRSGGGKPLQLFLGDSFVEAVQVSDEETFFAKLRSGPVGAAHDIAACGWSGWSPQYAVNNLNPEIGLSNDAIRGGSFPGLSSLAPAEVTYFLFSGNDLRNEAEAAFSAWRTAPGFCARDTLEPPKVSSFLLINLVRSFFAPQPASIRCISDEYWPYFPDDVPVLDEGYARIEASLQRLNQEVKARGARLHLALIEPNPIPYGEEAVRKLLDEAAPFTHRLRLDVNAPRRRFSEIAARLGVDLSFVSDWFAKDAGGSHYYLRDGHLNAHGHEIIAEHLEEALMTKNPPR